jgi:hypothetical protein
MSCARFCRSGSACRGTFFPTREISSLTTDSLLCYLAVMFNTTNDDDGMVRGVVTGWYGECKRLSHGVPPRHTRPALLLVLRAPQSSSRRTFRCVLRGDIRVKSNALLYLRCTLYWCTMLTMMSSLTSFFEKNIALPKGKSRPLKQSVF